MMRGECVRENNPHNMVQLIRLPGQQYDEETGLYYNRHKYYNPKQGRYITQDPIRLRGWNLYRYTLNPVMLIDPLGLYNLYELLYDVWHDDSYGTSSIDITASGDLISLGGHAGVGVGVDVSVMSLACKTWQECLVN
jgi:RHS repeat-associated protein